MQAGVDAAPVDQIRADYVPGWARARRTQMQLDGYCGSKTFIRRGVFRVESDTVGDSDDARPPHVAPMTLMEGYFKIHATIKTRRVSIPRPREALHVRGMYRYLNGVADDISAQSFPTIVDLPQMRRDSHGVSNHRLVSAPAIGGQCG